MRLAERQKMAAEKAKAILSPEDYDALIQSAASAVSVFFEYTNRFGTEADYEHVFPLGFLHFPKTASWAETVNLWAWHEGHEKKEQYNVGRIRGVNSVMDIIRAICDPSRYRGFWSGVTLFLEEDRWWQKVTESISRTDVEKFLAAGSWEKVVERLSVFEKPHLFPKEKKFFEEYKEYLPSWKPIKLFEK